ncbi:cellulase family glycosylhydrolase [Emticicia sp. CRIBPO]|uniref:cellulase family glycosylhydrolase n=1 Tax=Emticicia sp. CRIBPO TaxID=2683258 RepID=UPI00141370AC|nr:cellulase family glycosylhydrolase [Emticicia sp. CRIBPO]NBA84684.1 cellulase family glycosylhydrolase [Emticicia sp. CRIBPO]
MMTVKIFRSALVLVLTLIVTVSVAQTSKKPEPKGKIWSVEKANAWYAEHKWMTGANFIPSSAINQLEMWQAETFDPQTIDRELGYAEGIGFNTMRVFLHSVAYAADPKGFKSRVSEYLKIADKHHIQTIFVFFDDCWNPDPKAGKQPVPKTGIHNSGWAQDPGVDEVKDEKQFASLEVYVKDILNTFAHDKRILLWDLYNEPGNTKKGDKSLNLVKKVFSWGRDVSPDQPLSVGLWAWNLEKLNAFQALNSDIITYHDYSDEVSHEKTIQLLKSHGRPLICTEYMARTRGSNFSNIMPLLKKQNVGAINWGLVAGKTNTIYAWNNPMPDGAEPKDWFHDIFRKDGTVYREEEVNLIKSLTKEK